jgi:hypothetical protein
VWACGRVGVWACGRVGVWACGRVGVWACGRVGARVQEDLKVLEAGTYPFQSNRRNAMVIIKGEKEVCHHYIALASTAGRLLAMDVRAVSGRHPARSVLPPRAGGAEGGVGLRGLGVFVVGQG